MDINIYARTVSKYFQAKKPTFQINGTFSATKLFIRSRPSPSLKYTTVPEDCWSEA